MANERIREQAAKNHVRLWQIAEALGMQDSNFSRKMRHELPESEQAKIFRIIRELAVEGGV